MEVRQVGGGLRDILVGRAEVEGNKHTRKLHASVCLLLYKWLQTQSNPISLLHSSFMQVRPCWFPTCKHKGNRLQKMQVTALHMSYNRVRKCHLQDQILLSCYRYSLLNAGFIVQIPARSKDKKQGTRDENNSHGTILCNKLGTLTNMWQIFIE